MRSGAGRYRGQSHEPFGGHQEDLVLRDVHGVVVEPDLNRQREHVVPTPLVGCPYPTSNHSGGLVGLPVTEKHPWPQGPVGCTSERVGNGREDVGRLAYIDLFFAPA